MFPRMNITTPLPSFAYGVPQYGAGVGFGGISPMVSPFGGISPMVSPMVNPYACSPAIAPLMAQHPAIGPSPYAVHPMLQCPPVQIGWPYQHIGAGISQLCSPLGMSPYPVAQTPCVYPTAQPGIGGMPPTAFASPVTCPVTCVDPVTGAMVTQPYPMVQSLLPIRPLINSQQPDPVQMAAMCGMMTGQVPDPYSVMAQTSLMSPLAVSPIHQALRQSVCLPPMGSASICMPQVSMPQVGMPQVGMPQVGMPWTITAGIPC